MGKTPQSKLEANKRWRERHREQKREIDQRYREAHREEIREVDRQYREAHREERNATIREKRKSGEWRPTRPGRKPIYSSRSRAKVRQQIIAALGGKCQRCGFDDWRALQVDHVNGGGSRHRSTYVSMSRYYKDILASAQAQSGEYQLLCANCNQVKRYEAGEKSILLSEQPKPSE
jgi:hypothetical protein